MSWNDDSGPLRSQPDMLAVVRARARQIRRRRWAVLTGSAAAVTVFAASTVLAGAGTGGRRPVKVQTMAPPTTDTVSPVVPGLAPALPTTLETTTTTADARPSTTVSSPRPTTTSTIRPASVAPPTTSGPASTTTSTRVAPLRVCTPSDLAVMAATDRPGYPAGQTVTVTVSVKNQSASDCDMARDPGLSILDSAARVVFSEGVADMFTYGVEGQPSPGLIVPGQVRTATLSWGQVCYAASVQRAGRCAPGNYTVAARLGDVPAPPVPFTLG